MTVAFVAFVVAILGAVAAWVAHEMRWLRRIERASGDPEALAKLIRPRAR